MDQRAPRSSVPAQRLAPSLTGSRSKLSAYISIFNDWDILPAVLTSIRPYIDELVIVDGAYRWMIPFFEAIGTNLIRSADPLYDHLADAGIPYRVLSGVWENEFTKRMAGYDACSHRYRFRFDADEVYFLNEANLEKFLQTDFAVGVTQNRLYVAPGWFVPSDPIWPVLFDAEQVTADNHLNYLWLNDKTPLWLIGQAPPPAPDMPPIYPDPVSFSAHLTHWRTPTTSINRAAYYGLNWIAHNGAPWFGDLAGKPLDDLTPFFRRVAPQIYLDHLRNNDAVVCHLDLKGYPLAPSPLSAADEASIAPLFDSFLHGQAVMNAEFAERGRYALGHARVDMSSDAAAQAISHAGVVTLQASEALSAAGALLHYLLPAEPWEIRREAATEIDGNRIRIALSAGDGGEPASLRKVLTFQASAASGNPLIKYRLA